MIGTPICAVCAQRTGRDTCLAYPDGIPFAILRSLEVDHRQPYPGDGGILFEPDTNQKPEWVAWVLGTYDRTLPPEVA